MNASDFVTFFTHDQYWWVFTFFGLCAAVVPAVYYGGRYLKREFIPGIIENRERDRALREDIEGWNRKD